MAFVYLLFARQQQSTTPRFNTPNHRIPLRLCLLGLCMLPLLFRHRPRHILVPLSPMHHLARHPSTLIPVPGGPQPPSLVL